MPEHQKRGNTLPSFKASRHIRMNNQVISNKYQQIRLAALAQTQSDFEQFEPDFINRIDLTEINEDALRSQDEWEIPVNRQIGWDILFSQGCTKQELGGTATSP
jgi:hypothetical protein